MVAMHRHVHHFRPALASDAHENCHERGWEGVKRDRSMLGRLAKFQAETIDAAAPRMPVCARGIASSCVSGDLPQQCCGESAAHLWIAHAALRIDWKNACWRGRARDDRSWVEAGSPQSLLSVTAMMQLTLEELKGTDRVMGGWRRMARMAREEQGTM